jgi:hypothetical protein
MLHAHLVVHVHIERNWFNNLSERETLPGGGGENRVGIVGEERVNWTSIAPEIGRQRDSNSCHFGDKRVEAFIFSFISSVVDEGE